jgi:hypothetical protein
LQQIKYHAGRKEFVQTTTAREGHSKMKKIVLALTCVFLLGCAAGQQPQLTYEGITFETGKSRKVVMHAIINVVEDEGFSVGSSNEKQGIIVCEPRKMLDGVLTEKTEGKSWNIQTKASTFNHRIQFSANVSPDGIVKLETLVMATNAAHSIDRDKSEKLARYYEKKIKKALP